MSSSYVKSKIYLEVRLNVFMHSKNTESTFLIFYVSDICDLVAKYCLPCLLQNLPIWHRALIFHMSIVFDKRAFLTIQDAVAY